MKKLNLWLLLSLFVAAFTMSACSSSDDATSGGGGGGDVPGPDGKMQMAKLSGFVYTSYGDPLSGVTVTSGTTSVKTNAHGAFTLSSVNVVNGRSVVKFSTNGYADVVRSVEAKDGDVWEVAMPSYTPDYFSATTGKQLTRGGMKVDIPANSIKTVTEESYTGNVDSRMAYLDPNDENFSSMMPGGDLAATGYGEKDPSNPNPQLVSYGMTGVELTKSQTEALQLNGEATVTFPAPAGLQEHETIPLWGFNEETGLWEYEGEATKQPDGTYQGTVTHFSWHNLDYPEKRATCKVIVKDNAGRPIPYQKVIVGQIQATTDANGEFSSNVPTNTPFTIAVRSIDYSNYSPEISQEVNITTAGETRVVNIALPGTSVLSGTITNKGQGAQVSLTLAYGDNKSIKAVMSDINGKYIMNLPIGYTGAATLDILAADGTVFKKNILLTGADQTLDYAIDTPETAKGSVTFTGESMTKTLEISDISAYSLGGVVLLGNQLSLMTDAGKHHHHGPSSDGTSVNLSISENYSPAITSYTGSFYAYYSGESSYDNINSEAASFEITRDGNKFNFVVSGNGNYYGSGVSEVPGTIGGRLTYSLLAEITETGASTSPSSWVPTLTGKTPKHAATIADNPKLGTGWYYSYNSDETLEEFAAVVNSATAVMGQPYYVNDDADDPYNKQYVFISGNQYLAITYSGYSSSSYDYPLTIDDIFSTYMNYGSIRIQAFSNVTIPFTELVSGDYL